MMAPIRSCASIRPWPLKRGSYLWPWPGRGERRLTCLGMPSCSSPNEAQVEARLRTRLIGSERQSSACDIMYFRR